MGHIAVTGSVAFDLLARFSGRFADSLLPDQLDHINLSFLVDDMERRHGGTAANIAYNLALLGEHPLLVAAVGHDFAEYGEALERRGVDLRHARRVAEVTTASCFITTDSDLNQLTAFYPGAMRHAADIDLTSIPDIDCVVVSPDAPDAMAAHVEQAAQLGHRLVFAPAQQLPAMPDVTLTRGIEAAWLIVANEYELELITQRTGRSAEALAETAIVAATHGVRGSEIRQGSTVVRIPPALTDAVDPTGAGDAYLAGLLHGLRAGRPADEAGRIGSLIAAYAVERSGPQSHSFSVGEFAARFEAEFGFSLSAA